MKVSAKSMLVSLCAGASLLFGFSVRAENDYDFAKDLMEYPGFNTDDLTERLIAQLDARPATKLEGMLVKAAYKRHLAAATTSAEKKASYLDEARDLYNEVLKADKKSPQYIIAERDSKTIFKDRVKALLKAAQDAADNPAKAKDLRAQAAGMMEKTAAEFKVRVDETYPKYQAALKAFQDWQTKNDPDGSGAKAIPPEILDPLQKSFDAWIGVDNKYVEAVVEEIICYDDKDPKKKKLIDEIAALCAQRSEDDTLTGHFPVIAAWYSYQQGRAHAAINDEVKASEAWKKVTEADIVEFTPDQKKKMAKLQTLVLHDMVKLKMHTQKYGDVEEIIVGMQTNHEQRQLFEEDAGKELLVDYATAMSMAPNSGEDEFEKAISKMKEMIDKETHSGARQTQWSNQFARTMAEVLDRARTRNIRLKLAAQEWYEAAHGFFLLGQQSYAKYKEAQKDTPDKAREIFKHAYDDYQNAIDYYRRAIATARSDKKDLSSRVTIEPKSWFEMALAYLKMGHQYESVIAYTAMRDAFIEDSRKKWMPDPNTPEGKKFYRKVKDELAEIDNPTSGQIFKSGANIKFAVDENEKIHNNPKDTSNGGFRSRVYGEQGLNDGNITDNNYLKAKGEMKSAKNLVDASKGEKDPKILEANLFDAVTKYVAAAADFAKVSTSSAAYEVAMYQSGQCYTMAQAMWAADKFPSKRDQQAKQSEDLANKALVSFQTYLDTVARTSAETDEVKNRRAQIEGLVLLATNSLYIGVQQWEKAIKAADDYLSSEGDKSASDTVLLNKYRALERLAATNIAPKCDPYLQRAYETMEQWHKLKPNDHGTYVFMLNTLSSRNNVAAAQLREIDKDGKNPEAVAAYENKIAELQEKRLDVIRNVKTEKPNIEDYTRVVFWLKKTDKDQKAVDRAEEMLEYFDKDGNNSKISPEDEKAWQDLYEKMQKVLVDDRGNWDPNKWERCKNDHLTLVDYMYDTRQGVQIPENDPRRPANDKFNVDPVKAQNVLATIKKNYPEAKTLAKGDAPGKSYLSMIEDEIDFRTKIISSRELVAKAARSVAAKYRQDNNADEMKKYIDIASHELTILMKVKGDTPQLKLEIAMMHVETGKYEEAIKILNEVLTEVDSNSTEYFIGYRELSRCYAFQNKWKDAAEFPEFVVLSSGINSPMVKQNWPDMAEFLKNCYEKGAPQNPKVKARMEHPDEPKKEEPKKDEAKPDDAKDAKKDAPRPDEKKADEKKPEETKAKADESKAPEAPKAPAEKK